LQPVAGVDAYRPCASAGGWRRAFSRCLLSLPQAVLRHANFTSIAAFPGGSSSGLEPKPAFDSCARGGRLDFACRAGVGIFRLRCFALVGESHSALRAELRLPDLTVTVPHP